MDNAHQIVSHEFQQQLVGLRGLGSATNIVAEFPLDGAEGRLNVRPLVVDLQEFLAVERERGGTGT
jgi:hypothetical protein